MKTAPATSKTLADPGYRPRLQVSVLRRLLEVLPASFGYDRTGLCRLNDEENDDVQRPVAVTLTLRPKRELASWPECPEKWANLKLVRAGVHEVTLYVDEHGAYAFTAKARSNASDAVRDALATHVREVFGGAYSLDRRSGKARRSSADNGGRAAVRRYQGLDSDSPAAEEKPRGILNFFQLNTMVEGLFNESLSPAVFFEQNDFLREFLDDQLPGALTLVERMGEVIDLLMVNDVDAGTPEGLVIALRRFLDVTSREVLQKLKWSVESIRRSLLDESVSMMHRQSKLVQLDLSGLRKERTPEQAVGASESQLRGYVMLAAAKLPLVGNVHEFAVLTKDHLHHAAEARPPALGKEVKRLDVELKHWHILLQGLRNNVHGLEGAIEHAWRESLLYEQQQVRSEQEAVAEIERSRSGRPTSERTSMHALNFVMLLFTVAAVLVAIREGNLLEPRPGGESTNWQTWVRVLWPIAAVTVLFSLVVPVSSRLLRRWRDKKGRSDTYPYEFAFRLQEAADPGKVHRYLSRPKPRRLRTGTLKVRLTSSGGGRIERVSPDRALVKIHSIATFKVGRRGYARFEIVKEILAHRVSGRPSYVIIQCRMFGDSPRALTPNEVIELLGAILHDLGTNLTGTDPERNDPVGIDVDTVLGLISPLYTGEEPTDTATGVAAPIADETGAEPTTVRLPAQPSLRTEPRGAVRR